MIYDETHAAHLASRVAGTVWRVEKQVGDQVEKGDVLALIDAAEVGRAKAEFLQAIAQLRLTEANVERLKPLAESGAVPGRQVREADAALQEAQIRLLGAQQALVNLGLPVRAEEFAELEHRRDRRADSVPGPAAGDDRQLRQQSTTSNLFPLRSPLDGVVVDSTVVPGEVVDTSTMLFDVADVRRMWLTLERAPGRCQVPFAGPDGAVSSERQPGRAGNPRHGRLDQHRGRRPDADREGARRTCRTPTAGCGPTRSAPAGSCSARSRRPSSCPAKRFIGTAAATSCSCATRTSCSDGAPKFFHVRKVRPGVKDGDTTEIIAGLLPGEVIASKNSVVLEAQLLEEQSWEPAAAKSLRRRNSDDADRKHDRC